ncbi:MAG: hypothetical protein HRU26_16210 [Psychroserpens sp.]|nr:hypothetical protein [Psychroserpens sp.]
MFEGRPLIIATKHQKETVIAPLLEEAIGVKCFVNDSFDTDSFGTFSGEVERLNDPLRTARAKCLEAMGLSECDLGIASEGSFGAHPTIPFVSTNEELIILIDQKNNLEIVAKALSTATNFNGRLITNQTELKEFTDKFRFPEHGLILKPSKESTDDLIKGINDPIRLNVGFQHLLNKYGQVYVETDMRAMYNPMRMAVIKDATQKLITKINSVCPICQTPGFDVFEVNSGLPCRLCNSPTRSTLSLIYQCNKCQFQKEEQFPHGKTEEDPMYCDLCNP